MTERHRATDDLGGLLVGPATPWDQETALRVWMQVVDPRQQLLAAKPLLSTCGKDDRHSLPFVAHALELGERRLRGGTADDSIVGLVALELAGDSPDCLGVGIDGEDERAVVALRVDVVLGHRELAAT